MFINKISKFDANIDAVIEKICRMWSTIINAGRGGHINESDLVDMIDNGKIKNAYLDVFETEPLPSDHIFWRHKKINVWPHIAAETNTETSIIQIIDATNCLVNDIQPSNQIDRNKGY